MEFNMDNSLGFILNKTAIASKVEFNKHIKKYDISPEQWSVIFRIVQNPGISQKAVADSTYKDQGNLTRMIEKLEVQGYIAKNIDPNDKRTMQLFPQQKAIKLTSSVIPISLSHNKTLLQGMSDEESQILLHLLEKVYQNLQKESK